MATARLKTDSPLSRRIVSAFIDFLNSVEAGAGVVDLEGLEVAKECLADVFKIDPSVVTNENNQHLLISLFRSREVTQQHEIKSHGKLPADAPTTSSVQSASHSNNAGGSRTLGEDRTGEVPALEASEDEIFGQFFGALEKIRYFKRTSDGNDDQEQLDRTTRYFSSAVEELRKNGSDMVDAKNLAETFKSKGNKSLQSKQYSNAIELYTYAIALCGDNAVYFCNRAAAYTQINNYGEAIKDSLKSIEIDPNYGKAYSRLGFAYYAQGNYRDAIDKGFSKALQLDPNNDAIKENIRVAEQKVLEQQERNGHSRSFSYSNSGTFGETGQQSAGGSRDQTTPPPMGAVFNGLPTELTNMFMNMTSNPQGLFPQGGTQTPNDDEYSEPGLRVGGSNININLGEQMPEGISGALRSVMQMFSGATPHANSQDNNTPGGPAPR